MKNRIVGIIISIVLLVMILIPLLTFNWQQGTKSEAENRNLVGFPNFFDSNGKVKSDLNVELDSWFKDNIGLRDQFINLSSIISHNVFNTAVSKNVEIGEDGWLFFDSENNLEIADGTYPDFDEEKLATYCQQMVQVRDILKEQGKEFVLILPPAKVSIYPELLQSGDFEVRETPADTLADYIESHSDLKVVRLKDALLEDKEKNGQDLYFKTDTHWNMRGRYVGYKKIIDDFNEWGLIDSQALDARITKAGPYTGDLGQMAGIYNFAGDRYTDERYEDVKLKGYHVERDFGDDYSHFMQHMIDEGTTNGGTRWINPDMPDAPRLLIYGDSMIGECNIDFIAANFSDTSFVWSYTIEQDMVDHLDPDIVALDISERGLSDHLPGMFDKFLEANKDK